MKIWKQLVLFAVGGGVYVAMELCYRGYSHFSMFLAGGICFLLIGGLKDLPWLPAVILGVGAVTAVELLTGLLVNRDFQVWDYRNLPGNFLGQICPAFMLLWVPVTITGRVLYRWLEPKVELLLSGKHP